MNETKRARGIAGAIVLGLFSAHPAAGQSRDAIERAVSATGRPAEDVARDADRKPQDVMRFFEIEPGQRVAELMAGKGYYAELLGRVVGSGGRVYAQNNAFVLKRFAEAPLSERLSNPELANVERLDSELATPQLPKDLDAVLMILFYHDTYWQEIDRAAMNGAAFAALKPGGIYGVIDHHAESGSGRRDVKTLHRVDAAIVREEILAAGFEFEAESALLRHPEDSREINVFDGKVRGSTDRFIYRFRKPGS